MPDKKTNKDTTNSKKPKPIATKTTLKPKEAGGNRYGCGGKLKKR